jgi:integrase
MHDSTEQNHPDIWSIHMTTSDRLDKPVPALPPATMAELLTAILSAKDPDEDRRKEMASALRSLAKAVHLPLDMIPTDPQKLQRLIGDMPPAMAGVSAGRWRNIRSLVQAALAQFGLVSLPVRSLQGLPPLWAELLEGVGPYPVRYRLGRFARYCTGRGVAPGGVCQDVLDDFLEDLLTHSLVAEPARVHRDLITAWNRCATTQPGWPSVVLVVPDNRDTYAVPWDAFPVSLRREVDAWLTHLGSDDPLAERDFRPLRATSVKTRRKQIHLFLSALVRRGQDLAVLDCLAAVVMPSRVAEGLRFLLERGGQKKSRHAAQVAGVLLSIARHWVRAPEDQIKQIKGMVHRLTPDQHGMTERNRERLRQIDPKRLHSLLNLPEQIRQKVCKVAKPGRAEALALQTALAVDLLLHAPVRIRNLVALRVGEHLLPEGAHGMALVLRAEETKNRMPLEVPLGPETTALLRLYLEKYRPLLCEDGSTHLFPGHDGAGHKHDATLREQIQLCVLKRCGLKVHPHLFRHITAKVILDANPGAHGMVQRVLGHKNIRTTQTFYTGMETAAAFRAHDALIATLRDTPAQPLRAPVSKRVAKMRGGQ